MTRVWRRVLALCLLVACAETREVRDEERSLLDDALPRSGDPARPNVKVEVSVLDVADTAGIAIDTSFAAGIVRGVVDARAVLRAAARDGTSRTETRSFIIVQSGSTGSIALSDDARFLTGGVTGIEVQVLRASPELAEVALAPFSSMTAVPGETLRGSTQVTLRPGQAVVLGGVDVDRSESSTGIGSHRTRSVKRSSLVMLLVHVIG